MNKETGGPAFPVPNDANVNDQMGMTLRDYFAARAMQSAWLRNTDVGYGGMTSPEVIAKSSYEIEDAMLKAREQ